jgi:hypothetical protein
MALGEFIAGRYSGAYNATDVGMTRQGYELEVNPKEELINESDMYGLSTIDWVMRGADWFMQFESKEYKAGSLGCLLQPWGRSANMGLLANAALPISRLASDTALSFVLTDTDGTPAATKPATLTALKALLAPGYNAKVLFNSQLRHVPIRLQLLPFLTNGNTICFSTT